MKPLSTGFTLLPAAPGTCAECAVTHKPEEPHNQQSLHYQYHFYGRHGRWPKWADALAHCSPELHSIWTDELAKRGIEVSPGGDNPIILAVLQNQWFNDPAGVKVMLARHDKNPDMQRRVRKRLIVMALFAGCKTGRILKQIFGQEIADRFRWEEASPEIGGHAASSFPADPEHLTEALTRIQPDIVIAFGKIAGNALVTLVPAEKLILSPHPTSRGKDVLTQLQTARVLLDQKIRIHQQQGTLNQETSDALL